ncbi:hypothetical protein [Streptomyces sp. NPDC005408]|uniref:hypothetical protein n=1 Tax=Streptomyces sp. NPDC005408 TaxID=3155341 RepID=UPI0033BDBCF9
MKFREEIRKRTVPRTIDGITNQVTESYSVRTPVLPRDLDQLAVRGAAGLVLALTAIAIVWSTVSIGSLLGGGVGYAAAVLADLSWLTVLVLEWLARFDPAKRKFPRKLGWLLVAFAAGAIFWHGMLVGSVALAVVGASVSVVSKLLWLAVFRFIDRDLSDADRQWVAAEISKANAKLAVSGVRRQAAAAEARARLEILAAEQTLSELDEWTEQTPATPELVAERVSGIADTEPERVPLASANDVRTEQQQYRLDHFAQRWVPSEKPEVPSIAELAREQITAGADNKGAVNEILRRIPNANAESVAATVRRERRGLQPNQTNGYL